MCEIQHRKKKGVIDEILKEVHMENGEREGEGD
jgi:hypothetical protein